MRRAAGPHRRRPQLATALLGLALLGLPACASVPDSGPVRGVGTVSSSAAEDSVIEQPEVLLVPPEPVPGLSPEQVLSGFLAASAASDDDRLVAREYLTPAARETWDDDVEVVVHDPSQLRVVCATLTGDRTDCTDPAQLIVTGQREAGIDADGAWSAARGTFTDTYRVERVDGEWRLAQVPPGVRLTPADVARAYRAVSVGFLDPPGEQLVGDRLFLPVVSRSLPQLLVEALLRGPSGRLAPAVSTAVPEGTQLRGLALEGGVVEVDLSADAAIATGRAREALSAQLVLTLRQLSDVTAVRLLVEGEPLDVPGVESPQPIDGWPEFEPRGSRLAGPGYVVADDAVRQLLPGPQVGVGPVVGQPLDSPALDLDRRRLAGLRSDGGRMQLWVGPPQAPVLRASGERLTPPSWGGGRYGVWTARSALAAGSPAGSRPSSQVLVLPDEGEPVVVPAPELVDVGEIRSVRVSRDDIRVAVVAGAGAAARLYVGLVVPDPGPAGVALARFEQVAPSLVDVQDVSWTDGQQLTVLARSEGAQAAWSVQVDGSQVLPLPANGLEAAPSGVAAAPGQPLLLASGGSVWQVDGGVARQPVPGAFPFYPG